MKQTEQYGLNQWELADRIQMDDFNADNLKIAQALGGKLGHTEIIHTKSWKGSFASVGVDIVSLNWDEWDYVGLLLELNPTPVNSETYLYCFPTADNARQPITVPMAQTAIILLTPWRDGARPIQGIAFGTSANVFNYERQLSSIPAFQFGAYPANKTTIVDPKATLFGIR